MGKKNTVKNRWKKQVLCLILAVCAILGIIVAGRSLFYYSPIDYLLTLEEHIGDWDGGITADITTDSSLEYAFQVRNYAIQKFEEYMSAFDKNQFHHYDVYYDEPHEVWMVKADKSRSKNVMGGVYWVALTKDGRILKMWGER